MTENELRLEMLIVEYKGHCPSCKKGYITYRISKDPENTKPRKFLGCSNYPKCHWTSYKEKL